MGLLYTLYVFSCFIVLYATKNVFEWDVTGYSKLRIKQLAKAEKLTIHRAISNSRLLVSREESSGRHLSSNVNQLHEHKFKFKYDAGGMNNRVLICTVDTVNELRELLSVDVPLNHVHLHHYQTIDDMNYVILHVMHEKHMDAILMHLSKLSSVVWYDFYRTHHRMDQYSAEVLLMGDGLHQDKTKWYAGLSGISEIITIADTGIDYNHCAFQPTINPYRATFTGYNQDSIIQALTPSSNRLLAYIRLEFQDGMNTIQTDFEDDVNGHGTHVAGSAIGDDRNCQNKIMGTTSNAKLIMFDVGLKNASFLSTPPLLTPLMQISYAAKSRIFSNSWGVKSCVYDSYSFEIDSFVYKHDDYLVLFAAGNSGPNASTIASPSLAKNVITVGASQNQLQDFLMSKDEYWENGVSLLRLDESTYKAYDFVNLAAFSSRGPTCDGRTKPDVVSPGEFILSARAYHPPRMEWLFKRGTSMADPELVRMISFAKEILRTRHNVISPSAALIKNILITSAEHLSGVEENLKLNKTIVSEIKRKVFTSNDQGFGRASLSALAHGFLAWEDRVPISTFANTYKKCLRSKISANSSFGLVWTDPPARIHADKILVNDLNLQVVINNDRSLFGNGAINETDSLNTVEKISVVLQAGDYVVIYVYASGAMETLPPVTTQTFSLVFPSWLEITECDPNPTWVPPTQCDRNGTIGIVSRYTNECHERCGVNEFLLGVQCTCNSDVMCSENTKQKCQNGRLSECENVAKQFVERRVLTRMAQKLHWRSAWLVLYITSIAAVCMYIVIVLIK
jgi:subtilisin family serine protease